MSVEQKGSRLIPPQKESLLKRVSFHEMRNAQPCQAKLGDIILDLEKALKSPPDNEAVLLYHPARIINAILTRKALEKNVALKFGFESLISPAIELASAVYREQKDTFSLLGTFNSLIDKLGVDTIRKDTVAEKKDELKIQAFTTERAGLAVDHLRTLTNDESVLFIAFANGGTAPGLWNFIEYVRQTGQNSSVFFPVRFEHSLHDRLPKISESDKIDLKETAKEKQIVAYNDHLESGYTMRVGIPYLREIVFGRCGEERRFPRIFPLANDPLRLRCL